MIKCLLFGLDDTLYDASVQMEAARLNAIKAMIEAGLPSDIENSFNTLKSIVKEYGPHYNQHFDRLLERLGLKWNPRVIAAGVVAYRETSLAYLKPFPETMPTLVRLRDEGYKLGAVASGKPVKQWQKLIQLGVQHLFHFATFSEQTGTTPIEEELFKSAIEELKVQRTEAIYVGNRLDTEIRSANKIGITSVRIRKGKYGIEEPSSPRQKAEYEISKLSEILEILKKLK